MLLELDEPKHLRGRARHTAHCATQRARRTANATHPQAMCASKTSQNTHPHADHPLLSCPGCLGDLPRGKSLKRPPVVAMLIRAVSSVDAEGGDWAGGFEWAWRPPPHPAFPLATGPRRRWPRVCAIGIVPVSSHHHFVPEIHFFDTSLDSAFSSNTTLPLFLF